MTEKTTTIISAEYYETLVTEFIQTFGSLLQSAAAINRENDQAQRILRNMRSILEDCFAWRNPVSLSLVLDQLYFEELQIDSQAPAAVELIDRMLDRLIRRITIHRGAGNRELQALVEILNLDPVVVRDRGGPQTMLREDLRVESIEIVEPAESGNEIFENGNWKNALTRAGIRVEDVTRFFLGASPIARPAELPKGIAPGRPMEKRELFRFLDFLMDPMILAPMIRELASVDAGPGARTDPATILRIVFRIESALLLRSGHLIERIREKLSEALAGWDFPTRVGILKEALGLRALGLYVPNLAVYRFGAEEWAMALCDLGLEDEGRDRLTRVLLRESQWEQVDPVCQAMFDERRVDDMDRRNEIARRVRQFESFSDRIEAPPYALNEVLFAAEQAVSKGEGARQVGVLKSRLSSHIEAGYSHTVLGLLRFERDEDRVTEILENGLAQALDLLERNSSEAVDHLLRIHGVLIERGDRSDERVDRWLQGRGRAFVSGVLQKNKSIQRPDNLHELIRFLPLLIKSGDWGIRELLDLFWFESGQTRTEPLQALIEPIQSEVVAVLEGYLTEDHPDFSPGRFDPALGLYLTLGPARIKALMERCFRSGNDTLRMATLLRLARSDAPAMAVPLLRERLFSDGSAAPVEERIVAAFGLGELKDESSAEALYTMARGARWGNRQEPQRLRLAALYAFACIRGTREERKIAALYLRITRQRWAGSLPWRRQAKEMNRI